MILGVGGGQIGQAGKFNLTVTKLPTPLLTAPFVQDFETTSGGFGGTGDWQWGKLNFKATTCVVLKPPTSSPGHTGMWGTILNDCFNSLGNIEGWDKCTSTVPENDSVLSFAAVVPGSWTTATLRWREWAGWETNNYATFREIWVNAKPASSPCKEQNDWTTKTLDLTPWIGQPVVVGFHIMGVKPVGAGAGWYIDEVSLTENRSVRGRRAGRSSRGEPAGSARPGAWTAAGATRSASSSRGEPAGSARPGTADSQRGQGRRP